jgi:hypothetical protein
VEADLAQLLAKFFALVVLIKLEEGIERQMFWSRLRGKFNAAKSMIAEQ